MISSSATRLRIAQPQWTFPNGGPADGVLTSRPASPEPGAEFEVPRVLHRRPQQSNVVGASAGRRRRHVMHRAPLIRLAIALSRRLRASSARLGRAEEPAVVHETRGALGAEMAVRVFDERVGEPGVSGVGADDCMHGRYLISSSGRSDGTVSQIPSTRTLRHHFLSSGARQDPAHAGPPVMRGLAPNREGALSDALWEEEDAFFPCSEARPYESPLSRTSRFPKR